MSRRAARELVLHLLFAHDYTGEAGDSLLSDRINGEAFESLADEYALYKRMPKENQDEYINRATLGVIEHVPELDMYIEKYAVGWNVGRISRVSKCILRLCMYEVLYLGIPVAASVNEALELAKKYDSDEAAAFVNGIMKTFYLKEVQSD